MAAVDFVFGREGAAEERCDAEHLEELVGKAEPLRLHRFPRFAAHPQRRLVADPATASNDSCRRLQSR